MNRIGDQIKDQLKASRTMDFIWSNPFSPGGLITHLTNIHYSTEQMQFLENEVSNYKNVSFVDLSQEGLIKNHSEVLQKLRDYVIGPNLDMLEHNRVMLLIGNDFAFYKTEMNGKKTPEPICFKLLDYLRYLINNHGQEDLGANFQVKIATSREYFE